jgi:hypothetical protein
MYQNFHGKYLVFVFCVMALCATGTRAQIVGNMEAKVPFAFSVENTRLPAGDYFTSPVQDSAPVLEMTSADNKVGVFLSPESSWCH